jgi:hypothetical protein
MHCCENTKICSPIHITLRSSELHSKFNVFEKPSTLKIQSRIVLWQPKDERCGCLQNTGNYLLHYRASHLRRPCPEHSLWLEIQILLTHLFFGLTSSVLWLYTDQNVTQNISFINGNCPVIYQRRKQTKERTNEQKQTNQPASQRANQLTRWSKVLCKKLTVPGRVKNPPGIMEPKGQLPCSQRPTICCCPEPEEYGPYGTILLHICLSLPGGPFLQNFPPQPCTFLSSSARAVAHVAFSAQD